MAKKAKAAKKKPTPKKAVKKPAPKKAAKKVAPKKAAKKPAKKVAAKKASPKKAVKKPAPKKAVKKVAKKVVAKKPAPKKVAKKVVAKKPVPKKVPAKPVAKAKPAPVKVVAKPAPAKPEPKAKVPAPAPVSTFAKPVPAALQKPQPMKAKPNKDNRTRYSDKELEEFKVLILKKLDEAQKDYDLLKSTLAHTDDHGTDDTSPTFKLLEDGSDVMSKEEVAHLAARQEKFIQNLRNALIRIENKTYGICRVTGKLISKERLRSVPHATMSIDAKLQEQGTN